jgi:RHS repeat-associated protein
MMKPFTICLRHAARFLAALSLTVLTLPSIALAQSETIEYYGLDALGSVRAIFDQQGNVVGRMDYGPFGENLRAAIKFPTEQFAQLAPDAESGQDYAEARNYSPTSGRLSRVDPVYQGLFEPQRWNRYTYVRNNPLLFIDPTGLVEQAPIVEVPCPAGIAGPCFSTSTTVSASEKPSMWSFIFGFWDGGGTPSGGDDGGGGSSGFVHWDPKQYCAANPSRCDANGNVQVSMAGIPNTWVRSMERRCTWALPIMFGGEYLSMGRGMFSSPS